METDAKSTIKSSPEWRVIESLRFNRHRLVQRPKFRPLDEASLIELADDNELHNYRELFEDGLRYILMRNDLQYLLHDGLDPDTRIEAHSYLQELCAGMEIIVNTGLPYPALPPSQEPPSTQKYPKLGALLRILTNVTWKFEVVTGSGPTMFQLDSVETAKMVKTKVDRFNAFFTQLTRGSIEDFRSQNESYKPDISNLNQNRNEFTSALNGLSTLLSILKEQVGCDNCHEVLLQLPDWNPTNISKGPQGITLDLFLSICQAPSCWQEGLFNSLPQVKKHQWEPPERICDEIHETYRARAGLHLAFLDKEIYVFRGNEHDLGRIGKYLKGAQPSKTLNKLLQDHAFLPPQIPTPGYEIRFSNEEKRSLAARLVSSLAICLASDQMIECWDSKKIYFLTKSNKTCLQNLPYASCRLKGDYDTVNQNLAEQVDHILADMAFPQLAWLLMEIEYGYEMDRLLQGHRRDDKHGKKILENLISEQLERDLRRAPFLDAVEVCLNFRANYERKVKHLSGRVDAQESDHVTVAKMITALNIVNRIRQNTTTEKNSKRQRNLSDDQDFLDPDYHPNWAKTGNLGIWSGDSISSESSHPTKQRPQKKVKFVDNDSSDSGDSIVISNIVEEGDCELFGNDKENHQHDNRCKAAWKWVEGFKTLVKDFRIGRGVAKRLSVAILDTGYDATHPHFAKENRILKDEAKSWVKFCIESKDKDEQRTQFTGTWTEGNPGIDEDGHGTHIAGTILELTKNVDIYIGQIMKSRVCRQRQNIVKALQHARTNWKVDIISLSFGFIKSDTPDEIRKEIQKCLDAGIIVFASASNDGGNGQRTYPAKYDGVICIHSATGEGNKSSFNPSPLGQDMKKDNFSVLGECVSSSWPVERSESLDKNKTCQSGTSYAVPVAVSIAAFMIGYVRKEMADHEWNIKPWSPEGMAAIFRLMAEDRDGYDWVSPHGFFNKYGEDKIKADLRHTLDGSVVSHH